MKPIKEIDLKTIWTNDICKEEIVEYIAIQNNVFKGGYSVKKFQKKFQDNIYGHSLIVFAYLDNKCVGAMVFWRNDIQGIKAYQPCEMAVIPEFRGYGIFTKMNNLGVEKIGKNTLFYNYPNDNSLPAYLKMGWEVHSRQRYKIYNPITDAKEIMKIDEEYLGWLFNDTSSENIDLLKYVRINNKYYLLQEKRKNVYLIIGEIKKEYTRFVSKAKFPVLLHYSSKGYMGRGIVRVTRTANKELNIPLYKIGTLF